MELNASLKFGCLTGVAFCGYTTIMWLTRLDTTYLKVGHYLDIAILILPITMIFLAIRSAMRAGKVSILTRIRIALTVGLVSFVIYAPFLYGYHNYINPTWFDAVLTLKESQMVAAGADGASIAGELQKMRDANSAQSGILNGFLPSVVILPFLISMISLPFIRNRKVLD